MAIHPGPRTALVIGLGGGATAGAVSVHDGVDVDVVELAGSVVRGARFLESINYGVLSRPNVHLRVDDGRNYLMLTPRRYDVITADVIHPIFAGSGNLYSVEYFRLMRRVLNPGGLVLQWVAGTEAEYKTIARTFLSVFPGTTAWVDGGLLVGSVEPLRLRRSDFEWKLKLPGRSAGPARSRTSRASTRCWRPSPRVPKSSRRLWDRASAHGRPAAGRVFSQPAPRSGRRSGAAQRRRPSVCRALSLRKAAPGCALPGNSNASGLCVDNSVLGGHMLKHQTASVSSTRRDSLERLHVSVSRFAAWQRRRTPSSTPVLTRLLRLLAR